MRKDFIITKTVKKEEFGKRGIQEKLKKII